MQMVEYVGGNLEQPAGFDVKSFRIYATAYLELRMMRLSTQERLQHPGPLAIQADERARPRIGKQRYLMRVRRRRNPRYLMQSRRKSPR